VLRRAKATLGSAILPRFGEGSARRRDCETRKDKTRRSGFSVRGAPTSGGLRRDGSVGWQRQVDGIGGRQRLEAGRNVRSIGRAAALYGAAQRSIQIGMRRFEIADDFEIDALHLRQVDLFDMHESQQLPYGLGHFASALVPRAATLRDADLRPELFLVEPQTAPDLARIQDTVKDFHAVDELAIMR